MTITLNIVTKQDCSSSQAVTLNKWLIDVLPNINRTQAAERAEKCRFSLVTLTFTFEQRTKHVFHVNLAQIRSAVPEIFHTQLESVSIAEPLQNRQHGMESSDLTAGFPPEVEISRWRFVNIH